MEQTRINAKSAGLKRYISAIPCSRNHIGERYTSNGNCVLCDTQILAARRREKKPYVHKIATGKCEHCGNDFNKSNNANKYCSENCRFWSKVDKRSDDACWNWIGSKTRLGYGHFKLDTKITVIASRKSYEMHYGEIDDYENNGVLKTKYVCHKCDNPSCINPKHLFIGTAQDNALDMVEKGRHARAAPPKKYNQEVILKAQELYKSGISQEKIAWILQVPQTIISSMVRGVY